jgi:hypothetical protein
MANLVDFKHPEIRTLELWLEDKMHIGSYHVVEDVQLDFFEKIDGLKMMVLRKKKKGDIVRTWKREHNGEPFTVIDNTSTIL